MTLIAEGVEVSQREVEEGGDARCGRGNHPSLSSAMGKLRPKEGVTVVTRVISRVAASRA